MPITTLLTSAGGKNQLESRGTASPSATGNATDAQEIPVMKVGLYIATQFTPEQDVAAARAEMAEAGVTVARSADFGA